MVSEALDSGKQFKKIFVCLIPKFIQHAAEEGTEHLLEIKQMGHTNLA